MNWQGVEIVSKPTRASHRSVLAASLILLIPHFSGADVGDVTALGVKVSGDLVITLGRYVLSFLLISHLLNIWGDIVSLRQWNSDEKLQGNTFNSRKLLSKIDRALLVHEQTIRQFKEKVWSNDVVKEAGSIGIDLEEIKFEMRNVRGWVFTHHCSVFLMVFVWFLFVPIFASAVVLLKPDLVSYLPGAQ